MNDDEKKECLLALLEKGAEQEGTTLTKEQCALVQELLSERFNDGYACGCNEASTYC